MVGRPSIYSQELAMEICRQLAEGKSLRKICKAEEMPNASTVHSWVLSNDDFSKQYARAREMQAEHYLDEIIEIADDGSNDTYAGEDGVERFNADVVQRSKLRVDTRKWVMSKLAPKKYSDKVQQEHSGPNGGPIETVSRIERHIIRPAKASEPQSYSQESK